MSSILLVGSIDEDLLIFIKLNKINIYSYTR